MLENGTERASKQFTSGNDIVIPNIQLSQQYPNFKKCKFGMGYNLVQAGGINLYRTTAIAIHQFFINGIINHNINVSAPGILVIRIGWYLPHTPFINVPYLILCGR